MKKLKDSLQKINLKKLAKYISISILVLFMVSSISNLTSKTFSIREEFVDLEMFEQNFKDIEEAISLDKLEAENDEYLKSLNEEQQKHYIPYYTSKYPSAMYAYNVYSDLISEQIAVLANSIVFGIIFGIAIYIYKNSKKFLNLIISYVILIVLGMLSYMFILEPVLTYEILEIGKGAIYAGGSWQSLQTINLLVATMLILLVAKIIKTKNLVKQLNGLIKKN